MDLSGPCLRHERERCFDQAIVHEPDGAFGAEQQATLDRWGQDVEELGVRDAEHARHYRSFDGIANAGGDRERVTRRPRKIAELSCEEGRDVFRDWRLFDRRVVPDEAALVTDEPAIDGRLEQRAKE